MGEIVLSRTKLMRERRNWVKGGEKTRELITGGHSGNGQSIAVALDGDVILPYPTGRSCLVGSFDQKVIGFSITSQGKQTFALLEIIIAGIVFSWSRLAHDRGDDG